MSTHPCASGGEAWAGDPLCADDDVFVDDEADDEADDAPDEALDFGASLLRAHPDANATTQIPADTNRIRFTAASYDVRRE
jgi:hypothetical protein